jgi:hypothetical protein
VVVPGDMATGMLTGWLEVGIDMLPTAELQDDVFRKTGLGGVEE